MSMNTWIVYGNGFNINKVKPLTMIDFIKKHKKTFCQSETEKDIYKNLTDTDNGIFAYNYMDDFFTDYGYSCECSGHEGFGAVISNIMSRETGIRFEFQRGCDDCGSEPSVLFSDAPVWCYNETEKCLTEDKFMEVCDKYMQELEIEGRADFLSLEYYG